MNLRKLNDREILSKIKILVQQEREVLTDILHHLREVEYRKLFSDLGYQSIFEYAVRELKYSEGQASRRIQAMRLLKEIPQLEEKIQAGSLSLSNISQAQSYFRQAKTDVSFDYKIEILEKLENKSAREGERLLLSLEPSLATQKESHRQISETQTQVTFIMTDELKLNLERVKSLLGPKALKMNLAELFFEMSELSLKSLRDKKFGKRRVRSATDRSNNHFGRVIFLGDSKANDSENNLMKEKIGKNILNTMTPTSAKPRVKLRSCSGDSRKISKSLRFQVWNRDKAQCTRCRSQLNLNIDHIRPLALGGENDLDNLRLLCFHCNQRLAIKTFGLEKVRSYSK